MSSNENAINSFYDIRNPANDATTTKSKLYSEELEELRAQNFDLHTEIENLKFKSKQVNYKRKQPVVDHRRLELVYFFPPANNYSLGWHLSCRGAEYTVMYMWIIRDYGWFAHLWSIGFLFGGLSLAGAVGLLIQAFFEKNISEIWHSISRLAWLVATYVWMSGDLDINPKNDPYQIKLERRAMCGHILIFTILFESINRFIVRPMLHTNPKNAIKTISSDELPTSLRKLSNYDEPRLTFQTLRFKFQALLTFETWRDYENFQLLFWIGRDLGAAYHYKETWIVFQAGALLFVLGLLNTTLNTRRVIVDHVHYLITLGWLAGVFVYQLSFMYFNARWHYNHQSYLYPKDHAFNAKQTCVDYGAFMVIFSLIPILPLYIYWWYCTLRGNIYADTDEIIIMEKYMESISKLQTKEFVETKLFQAPKKPSLRDMDELAEPEEVAEEKAAPELGPIVPQKKIKLKKRVRPPKIPDRPGAVMEEDDEVPLEPIDLELSWAEVNRSEKFAPV